MYLGVNYYEQKHLAAAFAVFAATTMSFSAFAASVDANARAYERAAAEQYTYAAPQAATPALPIWLCNKRTTPWLQTIASGSLHSR